MKNRLQRYDMNSPKPRHETNILNINCVSV